MKELPFATQAEEPRPVSLSLWREILRQRIREAGIKANVDLFWYHAPEPMPLNSSEGGRFLQDRYRVMNTAGPACRPAVVARLRPLADDQAIALDWLRRSVGKDLVSQVFLDVLPVTMTYRIQYGLLVDGQWQDVEKPSLDCGRLGHLILERDEMAMQHHANGMITAQPETPGMVLLMDDLIDVFQRVRSAPDGGDQELRAELFAVLSRPFHEYEILTAARLNVMQQRIDHLEQAVQELREEVRKLMAGIHPNGQPSKDILAGRSLQSGSNS